MTKKEQARNKQLQEIVEHARKSVPIYMELYSGMSDSITSLDDFKKLPIITPQDIRSRKLSELVVSMNDISETRYPLKGFYSHTGQPRVLNYDDVIEEYDLIDFIFDNIGIPRDQRALCIADEEHNYSMSELAKEVAYIHEDLAAWIIRDHTPEEITENISMYKPGLVVIDSLNMIPAECFPECVHTVVTVGKEGSYLGHNKFRHFDLHKDQMLGMIGIASRGSGYEFDPTAFYIEEVEGKLVYTAFFQTLQPMIRYSPGDEGRVSDNTMFLTKRGHND